MQSTALILMLFAAIAWGTAALWFDGPSSPWLAAMVSALFGLGCLALLVLVRPLLKGAAVATVPIAAVVVWWLSIAPSNDRDWLPEVARLPSVEFNGSLVTIQNLRNFEYKSSDTDFVERWDTRTYDLDKVVGLDLYLSYWGPTLYAHTIASWQFSEGPPLAISIETRKEKGEEYSALLGFFRHYELYYVVADERDVIAVRTNYRGEQVYLYRLRMPRQEARALLVSYLEEINRLVHHPKWYNALSTNCTTVIRHHVRAVAGDWPFDWRVLANGHLDELGYERGSVNTRVPFAELRRLSNITEKAKAADQDPDFSARIREGLPERPAQSRR